MKSREVKKYKLPSDEAKRISADLSEFADSDPHAIDGRYLVRSIYFDDPRDRALKARLKEASKRKVFRIRYYNHDDGFIRLEKKVKRNKLGKKIETQLTRDQVERILNGDYGFLADTEDPLCFELYERLEDGLYPRVVVEYTREPYAYNGARVTLDYHIKAGNEVGRFFDDDFGGEEIAEGLSVMEIKWKESLPQRVKDVIDYDHRSPDLFSKYAASRMFEAYKTYTKF